MASVKQGLLYVLLKHHQQQVEANFMFSLWEWLKGNQTRAFNANPVHPCATNSEQKKNEHPY